MSTESETESKEPQVGGMKGLAFAIRDSFVDWSFKPLRRWLVEEMKGMEKGWVLCVVLLGLAALASYWLTNISSQRKLAEKEGEIKVISADRDDARRDLVNFKMDSREGLRQKDEEITRKESKINSLEQRLTYFETLPNGVLSLASNILSAQSNGLNTPREIEEVLTNAIAALREDKPAFELARGDQVLTNGSIIMLHTNEGLVIRAHNVGSVTANRVGVDFLSEFNSSNVFADGWAPQPALSYWNDSCHFFTEGMYPVAPGVSFLTSPIRIATNASVNLAWAYLTVHSEKSNNKSLYLALCLADGAQMALTQEDIAQETFTFQNTNRIAIVPYGANKTYAVGMVLSNMPLNKAVICWADGKDTQVFTRLFIAKRNLLVYVFNSVPNESLPYLGGMRLSVYYIKDPKSTTSLIHSVTPSANTNTFLLDGNVPFRLP